MSVNSEWNKGASSEPPGWFRRNIWENYRLWDFVVGVVIWCGFVVGGLTVLATPVMLSYWIGGKESVVVFIYVTGGILALIFGFWTLTWLLTELAVLLGFNRDFVSRPRGGGWPWWWWNN